MFYYVLLIDSMYATYVITPKTMKKYYGFIFIELNVGFSFVFFLGFFFRLHLCKWSGGLASEHNNEANFDLIPFCHDELFGLLASRTY